MIDSKAFNTFSCFLRFLLCFSTTHVPTRGSNFKEKNYAKLSGWRGVFGGSYQELANVMIILSSILKIRKIIRMCFLFYDSLRSIQLDLRNKKPVGWQNVELCIISCGQGFGESKRSFAQSESVLQV